MEIVLRGTGRFGLFCPVLLPWYLERSRRMGRHFRSRWERGADPDYWRLENTMGTAIRSEHRGIERERFRKSAFVIIVSVAILTAFTACLNPLNDGDIVQANDTAPPVITLTSPTNNQEYAESINVTGRIDDAGGGTIRRASWSITSTLGTSEDMEITLAEDGTFDTAITTFDIDGDFTFAIRAEDANGNVATETVTLRDPGIELPSFSATTSSRTITCSWDDSDEFERYDLVYTATGAMPSPEFSTVIQDVTSPYSLESLANGTMYGIVLLAYRDASTPSLSAGGTADLTSSLLQVIPLAPETLAPTVREESNGIRITWPEIDAIDEFYVYRRTPGSAASPITGVFRGTELMDANTDQDTTYGYSVRPAIDGGVPSGEVWIHTSTDARPVETARIGWSPYDINDRPIQLIRIGDVIYLLTTKHLTSFDVSVPGSPVIVDRETVPGNWYFLNGDMKIDGNRIVLGQQNFYDTDGDGDTEWGFLFYDTTTGGVMDYSGSFTSSGTIARSLAVSGDFIYFADDNGVIDRVDISDPANPTLHSGAATPGSSYEYRQLLVHEDILYTFGDWDGNRPVFAAFEIGADGSLSRPAAFASDYEGAAWASGSSRGALFVRGDSVFIGTFGTSVASSNGYVRFVVGDPSAPTKPATTDVIRYHAGDIAAGYGGVEIPPALRSDGSGWFFSNSIALTAVRFVDNEPEVFLPYMIGGGTLRGLPVFSTDESRLFVAPYSSTADGFGYLVEHDATGLAPPTATQVSGTAASAVHLTGDTLLVGLQNGSLARYRVAGDGALSLLDTTGVANESIIAIESVGDTAFLGTGVRTSTDDENRIAGPSNLIVVELGDGVTVAGSVSIDTDGGVHGITRRGTQLYVNGSLSLTRVDVTDHSVPVVYDRPLDENAYALELFWPYLYMMGFDTSRIWNVDHAPWREVFTWDMSAEFGDTEKPVVMLQPNGDFLYLAVAAPSGEIGLRTMDIYTRDNPSLSNGRARVLRSPGGVDTPITPAVGDMDIRGDAGVLLDNEGVLWRLDATSAGDPYASGLYEFEETVGYYSATDVLLHGGTAYVAGDIGLYAVEVFP